MTRYTMPSSPLLALSAGLALLAGCDPDADLGPCEETPGCLIAEGLPAGLLSVREGPTAGDVWIVGASPDPSDGTGPVALNLDGDSWTRLDTSAWDGAEIWWAWVADDEVVFVGNEGLILELDRSSGDLTAIEGPDAETTFFGVWGASGDALWAVGQTEGGSGPPALWRRLDGAWSAWVDPVLGEGEAGQTYFKVHGQSADDLWIVGAAGAALHWDGAALTATPTDAEIDTSNAPLLTVDAGGERPIAVGGQSNGLILEYDGADWLDVSPDFQPGFNGVCVGGDAAWAVGQHGARSYQSEGAWRSDIDDGVTSATLQDWHGCLVDSEGGVWTAGGRISARPLIDGVVGYQGPGDPPAITF